MRTSTSLAVALLAALPIAIGAPMRATHEHHKRALTCAPTDQTGSALVSTGTDGENVVCNYTASRDCEYFNENGTFSSGASTCPKGLIDGSTSSSGSSSAAGTGSSSSATVESSTSSVVATGSGTLSPSSSSSIAATTSSSFSSSSSSPTSSSSNTGGGAISVGPETTESALSASPPSSTSSTSTSTQTSGGAQGMHAPAWMAVAALVGLWILM